MSISPPVADLGNDNTAAGAVRGSRQPRDDGELAPAGAVGEAAASNVIELDPPRHHGAAVREHRRAATPRRVDPRAVVLAIWLADALIAGAAGALAYWLQPRAAGPPDPTNAFAGLAVMAMLVRLPATGPRSVRAALRRPPARRLVGAALRTLLPFVIGILAALALIPEGSAFRAPLLHWLTLWAMGATAGVCAVQLGLTGLLSRWCRSGSLRQAVAIFGTGELAEPLLARLQSASDAVELVGVFDDRNRRRIASPALRDLASGTAEDLVALSRRRDIDRVLVALPHSAAQRVAEVLRKLHRMPVEICLAPDLAGYLLTHPEPDEFDLVGVPLLEIHGRPLSFCQLAAKDAFDKLLALLAVVFGAPLLAGLALAIALDSPGPVLFRQNRYGFGERIIGVYKFRTMAAAAADYNGEKQAERDDPRTTRVGRFLRRWSLDELPQLFNVLRGEMSLVGPRPHAVDMRVEEQLNHDLVPDYALRHHMKPGITGWAQVNGHHGPVANGEMLRDRVRRDLEYINSWSVWFDLRILLRTVRIVLGQRHSY